MLMVIENKLWVRKVTTGDRKQARGRKKVPDCRFSTPSTQNHRRHNRHHSHPSLLSRSLKKVLLMVPQPGREKLRGQLATQTIVFFWLKTRERHFYDKKYYVLTFRDKTPYFYNSL